jgi:hypothetical protein
MLVAWGFTSAFGPLLIAHMRDAAKFKSRRACAHRWYHGDFNIIAHSRASAPG